MRLLPALSGREEDDCLRTKFKNYLPASATRSARQLFRI